MNHFIYDKTDKGREEIATRQYQLPTRLRTLLVLVDGKQTAESLLKKVAGLGLNEASLEELAEKGFIRLLTALTSENEEPADAEEPLPSISTELLGDRRGTGLPAADTQVLSKDSEIVREGEHPLRALQMFFIETIKSTLGIRGIKLQVKASRADSLDDFLQLKGPYIDAIRNAKGEELARSLQARLDQLLEQAASDSQSQAFAN